MSVVNGRLPSATLAAIPGGRLRRDAAAAWNAMRQHIGDETGVWIRPTGSQSSYRDRAGQQHFWNLYQSGRGNLAARPGTSNHGWGLAVDVATPQMATLINRYGAAYGWQKRWSDAPSEWWHFKYRAGIWQGKANAPTLGNGHRGPSVVRLKKLLYVKGMRKFSKGGSGNNRYDPRFTQATHDAVVRFQRKRGLKADGVVGAATWKKLGG